LDAADEELRSRWAGEDVILPIEECVEDVQDPITAMMTAFDSRAGVDEFENVDLLFIQRIIADLSPQLL
jgi:hypothetical protein